MVKIMTLAEGTRRLEGERPAMLKRMEDITKLH